MNKKTISIALLVVGAVLLVLGYQEFGAFGSQFGRAVGRGPSTRAVILLVCGGACVVLGALKILRK